MYTAMMAKTTFAICAAIVLDVNETKTEYCYTYVM